MKRIILFAGLILIGLQGKLLAQFDDFNFPTAREQQLFDGFRSPTERNFNVAENQVNIRDYIMLKKSNQMILELNNVNDFKRLKNLDSLIDNFMQDIAFYKDSLENGEPGNVRIDYSVWIDTTKMGFYKMRQIRFKKYNTDGQTFIKSKGKISKLKLEQDTVNIIVHMPYDKKHIEKRPKIDYTYAMQASFYLNNYNEIAELNEDREGLHHVIDTLASIQKGRTIRKPYRQPSSAYYRMDTLYKNYHFFNYGGLIKYSPGHKVEYLSDRDYADVALNCGAGLVRNNITPYGEAGIFLMNSGRKGRDAGHPFLHLSTSAYFLFNQDSKGNYLVNDNWFLNASIGEATNTSTLSMGAGYLYYSKGNYFTGTTLKVFIDIKLVKNGLTITPELISTNNFKQIFPGLTLKAF